MRDNTDRRLKTLRVRLMLTAIGSAVAGATRAFVGWLLNQ
ncbi:hypothetical protein GA0070562_5128 [Micromonospora tulbaghiae]|uniref:Uncharacterized protein n=1 Tax=Micromonospora tulbaghiae TaxID=479978 RepID=A0ABY0KQS7_9ACTN|nr:hypothetical protein GA0070562_5128 [Micromonospora tulbaghiae]